MMSRFHEEYSRVALRRKKKRLVISHPRAQVLCKRARNELGASGFKILVSHRTGGAVSSRAPSMDLLSTDEKNVRRAIETGVGDALRKYYGDVLNEEVPNHLADLLQRLDDSAKVCSEQQENTAPSGANNPSQV